MLPIPLVSLEMLCGSQQRATLCTSSRQCAHLRIPLLHKLQLYDDALWCGQQVSILCIARMKFGHNLEAIPILSMAVAVATLWISVTV